MGIGCKIALFHSPKFWIMQSFSHPSETPIAELEQAIARLQTQKQAWVDTAIAARIEYLEQCLAGVVGVADAWAMAACAAKGIDPEAALAGEEWIVGPVATLLNLRGLLQALEEKGQPKPVAWRTTRQETGDRGQEEIADKTADGGQRIAQVFPASLSDRVLWLGFKGEVWIEPGKPATQGTIYRPLNAVDQRHFSDAPSLDSPSSDSRSVGRVALVLGAGNISAIAAMDTLYKLFAENQVVLLKMNPVNDYVGEFLAQAFAPLIADGFLQIVYGGAEVGRYLCTHAAIETIHITGSQQTHDAIVWGSASDQAQRKAANNPVTSKPVTSELGSITPIVVVPGAWSTADLRFQAQQVASMVAHNASFNCVAGQVLVLAAGWQQRLEFLAHLRQALATTPPRKAYYPGAQERYQAFLDRYPQAEVLGDRTADGIPWTLIPDVAAIPGEYALTTEAFCGVLAEVSLAAEHPEDFLPKAVEFVNETLWGNLSCVILVDGKTQRCYRQELEAAIANLRVGCIGINLWTGVGFSTPALPWGAFPGNSLHEIQSGRGVVHNTYLFDHPQKSVLYAPFRIFPKPTWFANHQNLRQLARHFAAFQAQPTWKHFLSIVWAAIQG
jgi:acyl-CoA reductase-like NAD-dependent aldehyde dehydrogenase